MLVYAVCALIHTHMCGPNPTPYTLGTGQARIQQRKAAARLSPLSQQYLTVRGEPHHRGQNRAAAVPHGGELIGPQFLPPATWLHLSHACSQIGAYDVLKLLGCSARPPHQQASTADNVPPPQPPPSQRPSPLMMSLLKTEIFS